MTVENDPRIDPSQATDLGDEQARMRKLRELEAEVESQRQMEDAKRWYQKMRRSLGQRDRYDVFLKAEMRRQERKRG